MGPQDSQSGAGQAEVAQASFSREQVMLLAREDLNFFAPLLMPDQFLLAFTKLHLVAWNFFIEAILKSEKALPSPKEKFPQLALGWPRGHLKTTLIKLLACWAILFSKKKFILIVASNLFKAKNIVADICLMLGEKNVATVWGAWNTVVDKDTEELKKFTFCGKDIVIGAIGAGGDPRGLNINNERPDLVLMDDIQSAEDAESEQISQKLLKWMNGTLKKAKSQHGCVFIFVGNMFSSKTCILKIIRRNPEWLSIIVPGILADGNALWPELRSKEELLQELKEDMAMGTPEVFFSEIMNDEESGISACFDVSLVPVCPFSVPRLEDVVASFIIIDVSGNKLTSDDTSIIYYPVLDGIPVATEIQSGIFSPLDTITKTLIWCLEKQCPLVGVETVAYQASLLFWFEKTCEKHGIEGIHFVELMPKGRPKNTRIIQMFKSLVGSRVGKGEGDIPDGKPLLYLREEIKPKVFHEISSFKPLKRDNEDNILDNLAYAQDMMHDYEALMIHPIKIESRMFDEAKVVEDNCCF